jgi:hypothetical protein
MLVYIVNIQQESTIKMKKILLATILLVPFLSFADTDSTASTEAKQEKFQAHKEMALKRIDEKRACIEKAESKKDCKACMKHSKHHGKKDK